jgi:hypothetical protein
MTSSVDVPANFHPFVPLFVQLLIFSCDLISPLLSLSHAACRRNSFSTVSKRLSSLLLRVHVSLPCIRNGRWRGFIQFYLRIFPCFSYSKVNDFDRVQALVEAGLNTSTVALRVSRPGRSTLRERAPSKHCIGEWVGPRAGLDAVEKKNLLPLPGTEPDLAIRILVYRFKS